MNRPRRATIGLHSPQPLLPKSQPVAITEIGKMWNGGVACSHNLIQPLGAVQVPMITPLFSSRLQDDPSLVCSERCDKIPEPQE
jgi:hypothetical protein